MTLSVRDGSSDSRVFKSRWQKCGGGEEYTGWCVNGLNLDGLLVNAVAGKNWTEGRGEKST